LALALGPDAPAMHLDQALDHREPYAQPALAPGGGTVPLHEQVEGPGEQPRRHAVPRVLDDEDGVGDLAVCRHRDAAVVVAVLGSVAEQVRPDLLEPGRVALDPEGRWVEIQDQAMVAFRDHGTDRLDGRLDDGPESDTLLAELDLAARDAGDIE